ncbi:MAG: DUF5777 family beta-barrel protein [Bacteroidales bacterium]|nr:DUF5777 family beta-barrel protein [Bacteroidales bacterium]
MKNIYKILRFSALMVLTLLIFNSTTFAQEEATQDTTVQETPKERPVRPAFESGLLFDATTTTVSPAKTLEFILQHRFGYTDGAKDFFGIWGSSNIRVGLNYSILDNLTVGVGTTKINRLQDLQLKYRIIEQTRSNSIPVTIVLHEVIGVDGRDKATWDQNEGSAGYKFSNRISSFTELIVSRRFNDHLSLQASGAFTHYNCVDSVYDHDRVSLSFAGRYKFSPQGSLIVAGDFPLDISAIKDYKKDSDKTTIIYDKPNISIGVEISTSTHAFQIYLASAQGILPQEDIMWNNHDFFNKGIMIGFNLTRLWNF